MCDCCPPTSKVSRTVYVSSCTGSNRCGQPENFKRPYRSLDVAIRHSEPGWIIHVLSGRYIGSASLWDRHLIADPDVYIEVISADFVDGALSFIGQAHLIIPVGSAGQLRFSRPTSFRAASLESWGDPNIAAVSVRFQWHPFRKNEPKPLPDFDFYLTESATTHTQARLLEVLKAGEPFSTPLGQITLGAKTATNASGGLVAYSEGHAKFVGGMYRSNGTVVHFPAGNNELKVGQITGLGQPLAAMGVRAESDARIVVGEVKAFTGFGLDVGRYEVRVSNLGTLTSPVGTGFQLGAIQSAQIECDFLYAIEQGLSWEASAGGSVSYLGNEIGHPTLAPQRAITLARMTRKAVPEKAKLTVEVTGIYARMKTVSMKAVEGKLWPPFDVSLKAEELRVFPLSGTPVPTPNILDLDDAMGKVILSANRIDFLHPGTAIAVRQGQLDLVAREFNSSGNAFANGGRFSGLIDVITADSHLFVDYPGPLAQPSRAILTANTVRVGGSAIFRRQVAEVLPDYRLGIARLEADMTAFDLEAATRLFYNGTDIAVADGAPLVRDTTASDVTLSLERATGSTVAPFLDLAAALPTARYYLSGWYINRGGPTALFSQAAAAGSKLHSLTFEAAAGAYGIGLSDATTGIIQVTSGTAVMSRPAVQPGLNLSLVPPAAQIKELIVA